MKLKSIWKFLSDIVTQWLEDDPFQLAAALSYYTLFSMAPLLIIAIAVAGKLAGAAFAAKIIGVNWKDSFALGVLMNTRGLVELVILNAALDLGVSSPELFTMMVLMALITTFMTTPILSAMKIGAAVRDTRASHPVEA